MLKYLLSTLCIFLFFEDVRLNNTFKCASPDCSVLIAIGRAKVRYPPKFELEVNVNPGESVDIHGIDTEKKHYLVKVKSKDGFHLLPCSIVTKVSKKVWENANIAVKDPFQRNQSLHKSSSAKTKQPWQIEQFNAIVLNKSDHFLIEEKVSPVPVQQSAGFENGVVTKSPTEEALSKEKETPVNGSKSNTLDNDILQKKNEPASSNSESSPSHGTGNDVSNTVPQLDSKGKEHDQSESNEIEKTEEVTVEDVKDDLSEQENESEPPESGLTSNNHSSDSHITNTSIVNDNPSNLPSQVLEQTPNDSAQRNVKPNLPNKTPKVSHGDIPNTVISNLTSVNNFNSDENNETTGVGNDVSSKMKSVNITGLNNTEASVNGSDSSTGQQPSETNSTTDENTGVAVPAEDHATGLNNTEASVNGSDSSTGQQPSETNSTTDENTGVAVPAEDHATGLNNTEASVNGSDSSTGQQPSETNSTTDENTGVAVPAEDHATGLNNTEASVNGSDSSTGQQPSETNSTTDENTGVAVPAEDHAPFESNETMATENVVAETRAFSFDEKKALQRNASPDSSASSSSMGKENPNPVSPNVDHKYPISSADSADEKKGRPTTSNADCTESTDSVPSDLPQKIISSEPNENKPLQETVQTTPSPHKDEKSDSYSQPDSSTHEMNESPSKNIKSLYTTESVVHEKKENDPKTNPKPPTPTEKPKITSESSEKVLNSKNTVKKAAVPEILVDGSLKMKKQLQSDLLKNQFDSSMKNSDSSQEKRDKVATTSQFSDVSPENTDGLPADHLYEGLKDSNQNLEDAVLKEESPFYADIFGYIGNFSSLFDSVAFLQSYLNFEWLQKQNDSVEQQHCVEESCSAYSIFDSMAKYGFDMSAINLQSWSLTELHQSEKTSLFAGIVLCTFLFFTTLISILRNSKKKSRISTLISVVNQLEKKLLVATKEISLLEEQLTDAPVTLVSQPATEVDYESGDLLRQQIELLQVRNTDLEDKVTYLEKELNNVTTSAFEMHKLLENSLCSQAQSRLAEDEVDSLRALTERQDRQIDDLMKEMDAIVTENRYLKEDLKKMEKEFNSLTKKNLELSEKNRNLSVRLDQQIEETATAKSNYKSEIYQLQAKIEDLEINLRRSEFQIEALNRAFMEKHENKSDDQMQALQDDVQLKLQLSTLKAMNNELSAELKEQKNARRTLDDHIGDVIRKCNELTQALEVSEKGRNEAVNKLQVLTDYFNEKESQLQKEISAKEKLYMESENKDQLLSQKLSSLKEEIKNNKDRNEELKKEIEAQERSFKTQLATAEQKSRDLWFALRQAERKYQESEKEAATLRNKILILENNLSSANQKLNEKHSANGDINGQPMMFSAEMLSYHSPNDFIPPPPSPLASHSPEFFPPEPSYSPDQRLPPLGGRRVPSPPSLIVPPPEDDDFKPPLPHAQYMPGRSRHDSLNMSPFYGENAQYN